MTSRPRFPNVRRGWLGRTSLVTKFGVLSLLLVSLLGLVVGQRLSDQIEVRARSNATDSATLVIKLAAGQLLSANTRTAGLTAAQQALFTQLLSAPEIRTKLIGVTCWLADGTLVFSTDSTRVPGRHLAPPTLLRSALGGHVASRIADVRAGGLPNLSLQLLGGDDRVLAVYVPVQVPGAPRPTAAIEVILPYAPIATAIQQDVTSVYVLLGVGLGVLYLVLFRLVASASRRLRQQSAEARRLAQHDSLTGLPNRNLLQERVRQAIKAASRTGLPVAVLLLDLDRFKEINDTLGHHHGDLLLARIGPRLHDVLRDGDTVARLGGDEFVVLLPTIASAEDALAVARKLQFALDEPFELEGVSLDVDVSVGIAVTPDHGDTFEALLKHADVAMYVAKESHAGAAIYSPDLDIHNPARLALLGELRRGIDGGQLVVHYQPKADLTSGQIAGVEALVRWQHPKHGLLSPGEFIPLAERTGLIRPLTLYVLEAALAQSRRWADDGLYLSVAVNVSARCLLDYAFPGDVQALMERYGVPAERVELEITESTVMSDPSRALEILSTLARQGVRLSIDDFGTGYSSMAYLKRLPVHQLKIDRSFVTAMATNTSDAAIVASSLQLARSLGLQAVAEGVETRQVWDQLVELGCDIAQGYFLSRPVTAEELTVWLAEQNAAPLPAASSKGAPVAGSGEQ